MHTIALASLLGALAFAVRRRDGPLSVSLAIWVGSDVALSAIRGPLDRGDYADPWRYPVALGLWLAPAASGVALGCWRLLGAPLWGLAPFAWTAVLVSVAPGQTYGGAQLAAMSWIVLAHWWGRTWTPEARRALVVCSIDALAIVGAWPVAYGWITQAQATVCGLLLMGVMYDQGRSETLRVSLRGTDP